MAPPLLFDISNVDMDHVLYDTAEIEATNPHRDCMRLIDGVIYFKQDIPTEIIAYKDIGHDEFWVSGHLPGRPLFPGVLMIEAAAQVSSFVSLRRLKESFLGFVGVEKVKFRGQVVPGDRLHIMAREVKIHRRRSISDVQGLVNGQLVFEARIIGMVF